MNPTLSSSADARTPSSAPAYWSSLRSPWGEVGVAVDATGQIIALVFGDLACLRARAPAYRYIEDAPSTGDARREIEAYFCDPQFAFSIPLAPRGTAFQQRVWAALRGIPAGETRSYGRLAAELGSSPRAIGRANATNPICLLIPCHRVIGADGSLTGYAFGEDLKRRLLAHEGATFDVPPASAGWRRRAHAASASP